MFLATLIPVALVVGVCIFGWQLSQKGSKTQLWVAKRVVAAVAAVMEAAVAPVAYRQAPLVESRAAAVRAVGVVSLVAVVVSAVEAAETTAAG